MAILYVFKTIDPNDVGAFPPSILTSSWFTGITQWFDNNQLASAKNNTVVLFDNETELNAFLSAHTLSDAGLLADVAAWKSAHGVSYSSQYFTLTSAGISPTPIIS